MRSAPACNASQPCAARRWIRTLPNRPTLRASDTRTEFEMADKSLFLTQLDALSSLDPQMFIHIKSRQSRQPSDTVCGFTNQCDESQRKQHARADRSPPEDT